MKLTLIIFVSVFLFLSVYADKCPKGYEEPKKQKACKIDKDCGTYNVCLKERCCDGIIADPDQEYGLKCPAGQHLVRVEKDEKLVLTIQLNCMKERNFCPSGSKCVEGNYFAGCCQ